MGSGFLVLLLRFFLLLAPLDCIYICTEFLNWMCECARAIRSSINKSSELWLRMHARIWMCFVMCGLFWNCECIFFYHDSLALFHPNQLNNMLLRCMFLFFFLVVVVICLPLFSMWFFPFRFIFLLSSISCLCFCCCCYTIEMVFECCCFFRVMCSKLHFKMHLNLVRFGIFPEYLRCQIRSITIQCTWNVWQHLITFLFFYELSVSFCDGKSS